MYILNDLQRVILKIYQMNNMHMMWLIILTLVQVNCTAHSKPMTTNVSTHTGLSSRAVPSLVILGTAKGGTTDLWHIIHKLNIGFNQYQVGSSEYIQTKKELEFFSKSRCYLSSGSLCRAENMKILLRCPRNIISKYTLEDEYVIDACRIWLQDNNIAAPRYTVTASPSLMYEFGIASYILGTIQKETRASPIYIMLLKDPVERAISLYNHWYVQEGENGYSLTLEQLLELELDLLSQPEPTRYLDSILSSFSANSNAKSALKAVELLRVFMEKSLLDIMEKEGGRLNLRSFGLVLDGFYLSQILGWLKGKPYGVKKRLLIIQSEYFAANRTDVIRHSILPFLFPQQSKAVLDTYIEKAYLPTMQNRKPKKSARSHISSSLRKRLCIFYKSMNMGALLSDLQYKQYAVVVPFISGDSVNWWSDCE